MSLHYYIAIHVDYFNLCDFLKEKLEVFEERERNWLWQEYAEPNGNDASASMWIAEPMMRDENPTENETARCDFFDAVFEALREEFPDTNSIMIDISW